VPEADFIEISHPHPSKDHPYWHVDVFVRDKNTGKVIRRIADGCPVDY